MKKTKFYMWKIISFSSSLEIKKMAAWRHFSTTSSDSSDLSSIASSTNSLTINRMQENDVHHSKQLKPLRRGTKRKKRDLIVLGVCCAVAVFLWLPSNVNGQLLLSTRDPRFYSREGDYNYQWPNPGDPEYRWVLF